MTVHKMSQWGFFCDDCGSIYSYDGFTRKDADKDARAEGWSVNRNKVKCPKCRLATKPKDDKRGEEKSDKD